jgi:hypothetical protein
MIGWTDINPVFLEVFTECALDRTRIAQGFTAAWADRSASFIQPEQKLSLQLRVTRVAGLGEDETRSEESTVDGTTTVTEGQTGQRKVTLQAQAIVPEHTDEQWAMATMERVRMRLRKPSIIERLLDLEVSLIEIRDAIAVNGVKDRGRLLSVATMEIVFGAVANEDDPIAAGWIQYLVISSHLKEGSTELAPSVQLVNAEVPTIPVAP